MFNEIQITDLAKKSNINLDDVERILKLVASTSKSSSIRQLTINSKSNAENQRVSYIDVHSPESYGMILILQLNQFHSNWLCLSCRSQLSKRFDLNTKFYLSVCRF